MATTDTTTGSKLLALIGSLDIDEETKAGLLEEHQAEVERREQAEAELAEAKTARSRARTELLVLAKRAMDPNDMKGKFNVAPRNLAMVQWVNTFPELRDIVADNLEKNPGVTVDRKVFALHDAYGQFDIWVYNQDPVKEMAAQIKAERGTEPGAVDEDEVEPDEDGETTPEVGGAETTEGSAVASGNGADVLDEE